MYLKRPLNFFISVSIHLLFIALLFYAQVEQPSADEKMVEVGFGIGFGDGTGGGMGLDPTEPGGSSEAAAEDEVKEKPAVEDVIAPKIKPEETVKNSGIGKKNDKADAKGGEGSGTGAGVGNGSGSGFGYDIEWGGGGRRRIYNYNLPEYPAGVNKELDIRIRFTILPDGSVGKIFLLTKGDTRLENAAINSLRQWRFEPLRSQQQQVDQTAVIVFPYRLQ